MPSKPLTDRVISNAKPRKKPYRLYDSGGLYLEIAPTGSKLWRFKYRFDGKEKRLALGKYGKKPGEVSLKQAREGRDHARNLLKPLMDGTRLVRSPIDPAEERKAAKAAGRKAARTQSETFAAVVQDWFKKRSTKWAPRYADGLLRRIERDLIPPLGDKPIASLTAADYMAAIHAIADRGAHETAHRVKRDLTRILYYADQPAIADELKRKGEELPDPVKSSHAAITDPRKVGELLRAIDDYQGTVECRAALRFAPLVFVRPGELRHAEWSEIDLEAAEWRIPASKMKGGTEHLVPLSRQALAILEDLHRLTGTSRYLFPSVRSANRPMSENTLNAALRRMGYTKEEMTAHGFRAMASTLLNEQGFRADAIERQLAHMERDGVRAAYHRAEHLPERRRMMQEWADYLDGLRADDGGKLLPFRKEA